MFRAVCTLRTLKLQLAHPFVCLLNYLHTQLWTHLTSCAPKIVHKCTSPSSACVMSKTQEWWTKQHYFYKSFGCPKALLSRCSNTHFGWFSMYTTYKAFSAELGTFGIFYFFSNKMIFAFFIKLIWLWVGFLNRTGAEVGYYFALKMQ